MISISVSNVKLVLGAKTIFENLTWEIQHNQKIGLIGPNGAGKSSLFKLITGEYTCEPGGSIVRAKGISIGYLPQQPELEMEQTALEAAMDGNPRVARLEQKLLEVEQQMGTPEVYTNAHRLTRLLAEQQRLLDEYDLMDGDSYPARVRNTLLSLGLTEMDFEKPLRTLSGGQKKLVGLARLLLASPDVLLLDEPDNHLDLNGKIYLERFIAAYPGAVVIISHDRYLLDSAVTHIAELEDGRLTTFSGDYSGYIADKEIRLARQDELFHIQQREVSRLEMAIKRYAIWGRQYDNPKFTARARAIQNRLDRMERIDKPVLERRRMDLVLNGWRGSTKVLQVNGLKKSYPSESPQNKPVLNGIDLLIRHGERVGVIGPNGSGKSVLFRLVLGIEAPDSGDITIGPSVKTGYYAQEHETLDFDQTLIEAVRLARPMNEAGAVAFLISYLFTYKQASQKIRDLSGGERSRLQLALLVLSGANFLLLDEPTNNLDIASAEVLESALMDFEGTVLVISHDRYFLDRVVDRVVVLNNGRLQEFLGGYSDYLEKTSIRSERERISSGGSGDPRL
ncbi:MAG: ribosomal protection-like ABC-F family protein [Omnitrophica WOR_2 bacterium]